MFILGLNFLLIIPSVLGTADAQKEVIAVYSDEDAQQQELVSQFKQACLNKETQDPTACRELLLNGCDMTLHQIPTIEDVRKNIVVTISNRASKCNLVFKQECKNNHFHNSLCRVWFLPNSVGGRLSTTNSIVSTDMDDSFVKDVLAAKAPTVTSPIDKCKSHDSQEKLLECIQEQIDLGTKLIDNRFPDRTPNPADVSSVNQSLQIFLKVAEVIADLHPVFQILFFIETLDIEDPEFKKINEKLDRIETKIDTLTYKVAKFPSVVQVELCVQTLTVYTERIKNFGVEFSELTKQDTKEDYNVKLDRWNNHCDGFSEGIKPSILDFVETLIVTNPTQNSQFSGESKNSFLRTNSTAFDRTCAQSFFDLRSLNASKKFHRTIVVPAYAWMLKAMKLMYHCPGYTSQDFLTVRTKMFGERDSLATTFKTLLNQAEEKWKGTISTQSGIGNLSAENIRLHLEQDYTFGYVYSVVKIVAIERVYNNEHNVVYLGTGDTDDGILHNNVDSNRFFVFYRKKDQMNKTYGKVIEWKNKLHKCNRSMCEYIDKDIFGWEGCYFTECDSAWRTIRQPGYKSRNTGLQSLLNRNDGAVLVKTSDTHTIPRTKYLQYDISNSDNYQLDHSPFMNRARDTTFYSYTLIYPKQKRYMYDVAGLGKASQSSIYGSYAYGANRAIENNMQFTHTSLEKDPWWKVVLKRRVYINSIRIYNRPGYENRLKDVIVEIIELDGTVVWKEQYDGVWNGAHHFKGFHVFGHTVRVSLKGEKRILSLVRVEVFNGL